MATMRELAGIASGSNKSQVIQTSTQTFTAAQIQAQQIDEGSIKVFNEGVKGALETNASKLIAEDYGIKVRTADRYANYIAGQREIQKYYDTIESGKYDNDTGTWIQEPRALTSQDYRDRIEWEKRFHKEMVDGGVDVVEDTKTTTYRDGFIKPSSDFLTKSIADNSAKYLNALKAETVEKNNYVIDKSGTEFTQQQYEVMVETEERLGVPNARARLSTQVANNFNVAFKEKYVDGLLSTSLQEYMKDGVLTQEELDRLYNDNYATFGYRIKGKFYKKSNITDEAWSSMIKSFGSWLSSANNEATGNVPTTIAVTSSNAIKSTDIKDIDNGITTMIEQFNKVKKINTPSNVQSMMNNINKAIHHSAKIERFDGSYELFLKDDKSLEELLSQNVTVTANEISVVGLPNTSVDIKIGRDEIVSYFNDRLDAELRDAEEKGDINKVKKLSSKIAYFSGISTTNAVSKLKNKTELILTSPVSSRAKTVNGYMTELESARSYVKGSPSDYIDKFLLNDEAYSKIVSYKDELLSRNNTAKTDGGKVLSEEELTMKLKIFTEFTKSNLSRFKNENNSLRVLKQYVDIGDDDYVDDIVSGYVAGDATIANNSGNVLVRVLSNDYTINKTNFEERAKNKMLLIREGSIPFFGKNTAIVNPTNVQDTSKIISNYQNMVKRDLSRLLRTKEANDVDFANTIVSQFIDSKSNTIYTVSTVVDNDGMVVGRFIYTPEELTQGVSNKVMNTVNNTISKANNTKKSIASRRPNTRGRYKKSIEDKDIILEGQNL